MALRIDKEITSGWIDNRTRGKVTGELILEGRKEAIRLDMDGNCHRDLAGCRCEFKNRAPIRNTSLKIIPEQKGKVGDMTASRRCRVPDIPVEEFYRQSQLQNSGRASASLHFYADFSQKSAWRGMLVARSRAQRASGPCPRKEFCNYLVREKWV